jgi:hypothetical protein
MLIWFSSVSSSATLVSNNAPTPTAPPDLSLQSGTLVHRLFEGTLTSETRCLTCETVSYPPSLACILVSFRINPTLAVEGTIHPTMLDGLWHVYSLMLDPQRYHLATNHSSISRLISSKIRVSPHACASSVPARCCVSGTNFSATAVVDYRRLRSGTSCHLFLVQSLGTRNHIAQDEDQETSKCTSTPFKTFQVSRGLKKIHQTHLSCRLPI